VELVSQISVSSQEDMVWLGYFTAKTMTGHELIYLEGELGAGKTTFAKGFGKAYGILEEILSPTFVLLREYKGSKLLLHFDLYRLTSLNELLEIGFFDHLGEEGIKLVEWANRFPQIKEHADWIIKFENQGEDKRLVEFYVK
jgi:tRNA threonylcarbamoyladenosine biosynthesis protein TsaE